jgi:WD40 repeat protein
VVAYEESDAKIPNVVLFDVATGRERKRLNVRGVSRLAMAAHKPILALDTHSGIEAWDLSNDKRLQQWDYPECVDEASALTIAPDGTQVIAAAGMILRWDVQSGAPLPALRPRATAFAIRKLQVSADGCKLFADESAPDVRSRRYFGLGPDLVFVLFEYGNYYLLPFTTFAGHRTRLLHTTAWTIGSHFLIRSDAPMATVWDLKTGAKLREFSIGDGECAFAPDGTMIALSGAGLYGRDRTDIVRLDQNWTHVGTVDRDGPVLFSPDSKHLLVAGSPPWDIAARKFLHDRYWNDSGAVRFSPDGKLLALIESGDRTYNRYGRLLYDYRTVSRQPPPKDLNVVNLVEAATGKRKSYPTGYADAVGGLAYSPDGRWLASFCGEMIHLHDGKSGAELRRWTAHRQTVAQIVFSPDGKLLASISDGESEIALSDPATGKERRRLRVGYPVRSIAFTRDGQSLISVDINGNVHRWNPQSGANVKLGDPQILRSPLSLALSGDQVSVFQTNSETNSTALHTARIRDMRADPKAGGNDRSIAITSFVPGNPSTALAYSGDGKLLAAGAFLQGGDDKSEYVTQVLESVSQREIARFPGEPGGLPLLAVSRDNRLLAHSMKVSPKPFVAEPRPGGNVAQFDVPDEQVVVLHEISGEPPGKPPRPITGHLGRITSLAFSPDGKFLATGGKDAVVYVWRVEDFCKPAEAPLFKGEVAELWPHLADADAGKAYRAIAQLERRPKSALALVRKHVKPTPVAEEKVIAQHLRDLSSGNFAVRQQANSALEKLGEQVVPHVVAALKKPANLEAKRRLETLLERLERPMENADNLRMYRCLVLLDRINNADSRQLLEDLSRGAPTSWLTVEAGHTLRKLNP